MGARTNAKGYGSLLFFYSLVEKADVAVYLYTRMSDRKAGKGGRFPHSFICGLRNVHFLFGSPESLFGSLRNVLEDRAGRLFGLWLVCRRRASVPAVVVDGRFTMCGFSRVDLHCIWGVASLTNVQIVHVRSVGLGSRYMGGVVLSVSCRQALSQVNVSPN